MTLKTLSFLALVVSGFGISSLPAAAQNGVRDVPVNFPPASYAGRQFVDNRGCVYVRAGFDGAVTWVPRVTRQREHICGQKPTFGGQVAAAPASPVPTGSKPVQITATAPAADPAPQTRPRRTTTAAAAPRVVRAPASKPVAAQPPRVVRRVPAPTPAPEVKTVKVPKVVGRAPAQRDCIPGRSYRVVNGMKLRVSCGPQTAPYANVVRRGEAPAPGKNVYYNRAALEAGHLPPQTRIVPKHVYEKQDRQRAYVPSGYSPAWEDDRLNSYRAYQTVKGHKDTQKVWTNTVPRELVVQARRHEVKPPRIVGRVTSPLPLTPVAKPTTRQPTAAPAAPAQVGRWVEVGAFSTEHKARAAARRLHSAGLTVRMGKITKNGRQLAMLRVGPYASYDALQGALRRVHGTGYTQAYIR